MTRKSLRTSLTPSYPKPSPVGGDLIRRVISMFKRHRVTLPITSHIHIGVSGGADSMGLAHLLIRYGRRIQPLRDHIHLIHINHGWRGSESDRDEEHVKEFAREMGVGISVFRQPPGTALTSLEDSARKFRKQIFSQFDLVMTAHHEDDLFETLLWRLFTGQIATHFEGIRFSHQNEMRPVLNCTRMALRAYLQEEGLKWREDLSNQSLRFLRNRIRLVLIPELLSIFPRAKQRTLEILKSVQKDCAETSLSSSKPLGFQSEQLKVSQDLEQLDTLDLVFRMAALSGGRLRKTHLDSVKNNLEINPDWTGKVDLPENWQLSRSLEDASNGAKAVRFKQTKKTTQSRSQRGQLGPAKSEQRHLKITRAECWSLVRGSKT